ncbi:MAG: hypothetical protein KAT06_05780 [Gammaproteobacteria bacterium]|nr:hypothetical protein [Gammaproteobacteria bacterium]
MFESYKETVSILKTKFSNYGDLTKARTWLDTNIDRVRILFENYTLRDFIFEPFNRVFDSPAKKIDSTIYSVITQVAIINMVLAGLPGKLGVGVWVSIALEAWMAFSIAKYVGINIKSVSDIWKYFGVLAASVGVILYGFRAALGLFFSIFSVIPGVNPLIFAELVVTNLVGILFWIGFQEASRSGEFNIPKKSLVDAYSHTKNLVKHQYSILKNTLSLDNIKLVGQRLVTYLKGDFPVDTRIINGELFSTVAMAYLISGQFDKLQGPLGEVFIDAIRFRWSSQFNENTSIEEIAERFREYDADQLEGVISTIRGKMFEIMVTEQENRDGDQWSAKMHTDETFPGSDIIFTNDDTGEQIDVSLKAVAENNSQIVEHALVRYPDIPIMTTDEIAALYGDDERVFGSSFLHEDMDTITKERFEELISSIQPISAQQVVIGGVTMGMMSALWPFVMAYLRKKVTYEQLKDVFQHVLGESGVMLVSRLSYATIFGPLFAWYLLARGVKGLVVMAESNVVRHIEFKKI